MSFKDPFRKSAPKQPETTSNQAPKIDATRENVKKQLINALDMKKFLNIIKYNKNIKKRVNININDYKEYL